jgi:hypothetical protein
MHITQITKQCYYFIKGEVHARNQLAMNMLRDFNSHEDSDRLVRECMCMFNESDYARNLEIKSQPKKSLFPSISETQPKPRPEMTASFDEIRKILGINDGYNYEEVSDYILSQMEI